MCAERPRRQQPVAEAKLDDRVEDALVGVGGTDRGVDNPGTAGQPGGELAVPQMPAEPVLQRRVVDPSGTALGPGRRGTGQRSGQDRVEDALAGERIDQ